MALCGCSLGSTPVSWCVKPDIPCCTTWNSGLFIFRHFPYWKYFEDSSESFSLLRVDFLIAFCIAFRQASVLRDDLATRPAIVLIRSPDLSDLRTNLKRADRSLTCEFRPEERHFEAASKGKQCDRYDHLGIVSIIGFPPYRDLGFPPIIPLLGSFAEHLNSQYNTSISLSRSRR